MVTVYLMLQNNISIETINYRLKKESLKPNVKLKYNALANNQGTGTIADYSSENYYWGAQLSYPIFTRKERGNLEIARVKLEDAEVKLVGKKENIRYKIVSTYNALSSLQEQLEVQEESVMLYNELLKSEITLFDIGESSMFILNTREQNLIDAKIKLIESKFNFFKAVSLYRYHLFQYI